MKELKEQIAEIYCISREWRCDENHLELGGVFANEILSLPIAEGLWVEKKCDNCEGKGKIAKEIPWNEKVNKIILIDCPICQGTGIIRRVAEWGDVDIAQIVKALQYLEYCDGWEVKPIIQDLLKTSDGGKLVCEK